jgi:hypothetical protein
MLRSLSKALLLALGSQLVGCNAGQLQERRDAYIPTRVTLGQAASAWAVGAVTEDKECTLEGGEFGPIPQFDCTNYRELKGTMTSLECLPAEACADITLEGQKATFVPLTETFRVHAVGDVEGVKVEKTADIVASLPKVVFGSRGVGPDGRPLLSFEKGVLHECVSPPGYDTTLVAVQDGAPLDVVAGPSHEGRCWDITTKSQSEVTLEAHLVRPDRVLVAKAAQLTPLSDVTRIEVRDSYCKDAGIAARFQKDTATYGLGFTARGFTARGSELLPAFTSRIEGAGVGLKRIGPPNGPSSNYVLDGPPRAGAVVVLEAGGTTVYEPIRILGQPCDMPTSGR